MRRRPTAPPASIDIVSADQPSRAAAGPLWGLNALTGLAALTVCLAATLPYVSTVHNYFVQDDFGVVQLLASKPAWYFPRWFTTTWMDGIWGFIPDEIRPFPAVSYQIAALWGAASPVANHVINIAFHAANGLLVLGMARTVVGLSPASATFAALTFVLLPIQAESVAWITGRVDSMPAFFYVASFLAYASWRRAGERTGGSGTRAGSREHWRYASALVLLFIALFSKQNAITLGPALVLYDAIVDRRSGRASWTWVRPYVPFALLTAGYLWLRYLVFGEVARESQLTAQNLTFFGSLVTRHLRRLLFGSVTAGSFRHWIALLVVSCAVWLAARSSSSSRSGSSRFPSSRSRSSGSSPDADAAARAARSVAETRDRSRLWRSILYFGPIWLVLGIAPILVANYESPRHMYLASLGWAILLGIAFHVLWHAQPRRAWRAATTIAAAALLTGYTLQLRTAITAWNTVAAISKKATADLEREALAVPEGSLVIAGAPASVWEWSLPFAAQPPFTHTEVTARILLISPLRLHCCRFQWNDYTRHALQTWIARADRPPLVALHWDARTGVLSRVTDREEPFLRDIAQILLETKTPDALDDTIRDLLTRVVAGRSSR